MLFHAMMEFCLDLLRSKFWLIGEWSIVNVFFLCCSAKIISIGHCNSGGRVDQERFFTIQYVLHFSSEWSKYYTYQQSYIFGVRSTLCCMMSLFHVTRILMNLDEFTFSLFPYRKLNNCRTNNNERRSFKYTQ
jgi:hypothetical protein